MKRWTVLFLFYWTFKLWIVIVHDKKQNKKNTSMQFLITRSMLMINTVSGIIYTRVTLPTWLVDERLQDIKYDVATKNETSKIQKSINKPNDHCLWSRRETRVPNPPKLGEPLDPPRSTSKPARPVEEGEPYRWRESGGWRSKVKLFQFCWEKKNNKTKNRTLTHRAPRPARPSLH